jgi:hypothetical protein
MVKRSFSCIYIFEDLTKEGFDMKASEGREEE